MFRNRAIQMTFVRPTQTDAPPSDTTVADLAYITSETSRTMFKGVGALMLAYVVADTGRKIAIHAVKTYMK